MEAMQRPRTEAEKKKEVLHHFKEEAEGAVEEALTRRRRSAKIPTAAADAGGNATVSPASEEVAAADSLDTTPKREVASDSVEGDQKKVEKTSEEIVHFDRNEGSGPEWSHSNSKVEESKHVHIDPVMPVISGKPVRLPTSTSPQLQEETDEGAEVDDVPEFESGEEEIEVEFERAVEKMHTHDDYNMYCPNCSGPITKVVLRRKIRPGSPIPEPTQPGDLFGCLSCLKIFFCPDWISGKTPHENRSEDSSSPKVTDESRDQANDQGEIKKDDVRIPVGGTSGTMAPSQRSRSLEIVKSIVYGGLMESITSLSVVSSAAASDATTLNIVALGLANLVGGLVVLAHNLRDLRYGDSSEANENRYKEQLGRKEHFLLHATLAVLSYLVFGLIPPVIYGFTFRASDDGDYKILAVAAASLLCIVILAIAKAYTHEEHKFMAYFKTILYYVASAGMVSGIAYAVGDLVNKLLERLGWLNPATVEPQLFSQAKSFHPTSLASY